MVKCQQHEAIIRFENLTVVDFPAIPYRTLYILVRSRALQRVL